MKYILFAFLIALAVTAAIEITRALRTFRKFRGQRIVSCPETHQPAAVNVSAVKAAAEAIVGTPHPRLSECSRWPEKEACGQECLAQIEEAPKACLVSTIVNRWYAGRSCVYCQTPFHQIHWHDHPPALLDEHYNTIEWKDIPPDQLQQAFRTHLPVCWNCHIAESFRRVHPELVVDRRPH